MTLVLDLFNAPKDSVPAAASNPLLAAADAEGPAADRHQGLEVDVPVVTITQELQGEKSDLQWQSV